MAMNPQVDMLLKRRSVRRYQAREVPDALVDDLLAAAMAAPSAVARDPWDFIVVRDQARRERIAAALPNGKFLMQAPVGIVVCGDLSRAHDGQLSYLLQDCSAAIENLLLAASMSGLGACWLGVHPREDRIRALTDLFQLPDKVLPIAVIAVGWPGEDKPPRTRFNRERVHHETWQ